MGESEGKSNNLKDLYWLTKKYPLLLPLYKERKILYKTLINESKRNFNSTAIDLSSNRAKKSWKIINTK